MKEEEKKQEEDKTQESNQEDSSKLTENYDAAVRPFVDLIDQLRSLGIEKDIEIPQIAVMGDQSSGKSSVLESLCGVPFPRGSGLVTRCATQIRMKKTPRGTAWSARIALSWSKEQPEGSGVISDRSELGDRISNLTECLLEESATDFSTDSIVIDILSSDVPDLTVVDLPGIIRTTTEGQSKNVIDDVNRLIDSYLKQTRTIILAVIPANVDIATVDILEKAAAVDPSGDRTLGVFTKPDLVDLGTEKEVVAVLTNQLKPLKNGYNMLRNRNNKELNADMPIEEAHSMEKEYFRDHPIYGALPEEYFGIQNLTQKLTDILVSRIHDYMPKMKEELAQLLSDTSEALLAMGTPAPQDTAAQFMEYHRMCESFSVLYGNALSGVYVDQVFTQDSSLQLCAYAKKQFYVLHIDLRSSEPSFSGTTFIRDLKSEIDSSRGRELPGFLSINVFKKLMSTYIERWRDPSLFCLLAIKEECVRACEELLRLKLAHYPALLSFVYNAVSKCIEAAATMTGQKIEQTVDMEIEEPYTQNHYYMDTANKLRADRFLSGLEGHLRPLQKQFQLASSDHDDYDDDDDDDDEPLPTTIKGIKMTAKDLAADITTWYMSGIGNASNEEQEANDMSIVLQSYWKVALKRFADCIPQIIQKDLLDGIRDQLSAMLMCYDAEKMATFFQVPKSLQKKRLQLEEKEARLKKALAMLQEISLAAGGT